MMPCLSVILALLAVLVPLASAASTKEVIVTYETVDVSFPGAGFTVVAGALPDSSRVGTYVDRFGGEHGWLQEAGHLSWLRGMTAQDMSLAGVTGWFRAAAVTPQGDIFTHSFIYHEGTFQPLVGPRSTGPGRPFPTLIEAIAINDAGQVCGVYRDPITNAFVGFLYTPDATPLYTTLEVPGAVSTACLALSQDGRTLLRATVAGNRRYYLLEFGTFTELSIPDFPEADLVAFHEHRIAGNLGTIGFLYDEEAVHEIAVPGARLTDVHGLLVVGKTVQVYGRYIREEDDTHHGFVATLDAVPARRVARRTRAQRRGVMAAADCSASSKRWECVEARRAQARP